MTVSYTKNIGRPGATYALLDVSTRKAIMSATADSAGVVTIGSAKPGTYLEQITYTMTEGKSGTQTVTGISPHPITIAPATGQINGPVLSSPDGSLWQILVDNAGALTATKLA